MNTFRMHCKWFHEITKKHGRLQSLEAGFPTLEHGWELWLRFLKWLFSGCFIRLENGLQLIGQVLMSPRFGASGLKFMVFSLMVRDSLILSLLPNLSQGLNLSHTSVHWCSHYWTDWPYRLIVMCLQVIGHVICIACIGPGGDKMQWNTCFV